MVAIIALEVSDESRQSSLKKIVSKRPNIVVNSPGARTYFGLNFGFFFRKFLLKVFIRKYPPGTSASQMFSDNSRFK